MSSLAFLIVLLATPATSPASAVVVVRSPSGQAPVMSVADVLDTLSLWGRAHTALQFRSTEQVGVDVDRLAACPPEAWFSCAAREVGDRARVFVVLVLEPQPAAADDAAPGALATLYALDLADTRRLRDEREIYAQVWSTPTFHIGDPRPQPWRVLDEDFGPWLAGRGLGALGVPVGDAPSDAQDLTRSAPTKTSLLRWSGASLALTGGAAAVVAGVARGHESTMVCVRRAAQACDETTSAATPWLAVASGVAVAGAVGFGFSVWGEDAPPWLVIVAGVSAGLVGGVIASQ